jgi:hypothetical protein
MGEINFTKHGKEPSESLASIPVVTVEQIVRFRDAALRIEQQRDELLVACLKYQKCCETIVTIDGHEMSAPMEDWYEFDEAIAKAHGVLI